ncbi:MAG: RNA polymerase subunit sigma-70 [Marinilabiliales bacterium]|nr:MAG: RNA polymerase subunit sigma-70 [Marinilabiliales bacterium]
MLSELSDIIKQVKQGDHSAFKILVEKHQLYAYKLAFRILYDDEEAKDVVQDSFIKIWKNIHSFNSKQKFTTWMYKVVTNTAIDRYRTIKKSSKVDFTMVNEAINNLSDKNTLIDFENKQLGELIKYLADKLPEKQRLVFVLRDLQGMESQEVQEILVISETVVKSNLYHARKTIREKLQTLMAYERR